jgi:hypothetical protein
MATTSPASSALSSSQFGSGATQSFYGGSSSPSSGSQTQVSPGVSTSAQMTGLNGNLGSYGNPTTTGAGSGGYGTGSLNLPGGGDGSFI